MEVIPGIYCRDLKSLKEKLNQTKELGASWIHIDVSDGRFTPAVTWNNPEDLDALGDELAGLHLEVHLMVEEPQTIVENWLNHGVNRIIVHEEALKDGWEIIVDKIDRYGAELGVAINLETSVENLKPYLKSVAVVELLAVAPGFSGQVFNPVILEKIKELRKRESNVMIEVDGGMNEETAKKAEKAGADIIVSTSYIWESKNPKEAYEKLKG